MADVTISLVSDDVSIDLLGLPAVVGEYVSNEPAGRSIAWRARDELFLHAERAGGKGSVSLWLRIITERVLPPALAIFSEIRLGPDNAYADVPLHACAPVAEIIEHEILLEDPGAGHVRRRGLFVWAWSDVAAGGSLPRCALVKVDRSGGIQIPEQVRDFALPQ